MWAWEEGAHVFHRGQPADVLLLIRSGRLKVVSSAPTGKEVLLALRGPGDMLGEFAALDGRPRSASVVALTGGRGWTVPANLLLDHVTKNPSVAVPLLRLLVARLREADDRRLEFGALDTIGRIASMLTSLHEQNGRNGWLRLTQTELGQSVGASREATVKALGRLRSSGLIETSRGRVRVLRFHDLSRVAKGQFKPG